MPHWERAFIFLAVLAATLGCGAPQTPGAVTQDASPVGQPAVTHSRIVAAILGDPRTLSATMNSAGTGGQPGVEEVERLIHAGLAIRDDRGILRPQLGETVPTIENGLWKVFPDGRMELTWKIRPDAQWHDGAPVTTADLLFTIQVGQDKELPLFRHQAYNALGAVEAQDARTITVRWQEPYIWADNIFTAALAMPLPRHLLESTYSTDKARFTELPYWTEEFVGTGPYEVRSWVRGGQLVLQANDHFVLGRPRVDEIEVKFISDPNTMTANILAGTVDLLMGRGFSIDAAAQLREQWNGGRIAFPLGSWIALYPQGMNPSPSIIGNPEFRRALLHATDREEMVQSIQQGLVPIADTIFTPEDPMYRDVERSVVAYPYDPRKATEMIGQLGITRGADGSLPIAPLEIRVAGTQGDSSNKGALVVTDFWKRIGLTVEPVQIPNQRRNDLEYRANFPGFTIQRQPSGEDGMLRFHSREAPVAENNWVGDNKGRYTNPELDGLLDRYFVTIARGDRAQIAARVVQHMTSQAVPLGLFYDAAPVVVANRLDNVIPVNVGWNVTEWTAR